MAEDMRKAEEDVEISDAPKSESKGSPTPESGPERKTDSIFPPNARWLQESLPAYPYKPLAPGETRLITIKAGAFEEKLNLSLSHASLSAPPPFEALSYVWKTCISRECDRAPEDEIMYATCMSAESKTAYTKSEVHHARWADLPYLSYIPQLASMYFTAGGLRPPGQVEVDGVPVTLGGELCSALKRLRHPDRDRVVWADAICINQQDLEERAQQVGSMLSIYSVATRVVVYLGEFYTDCLDAGFTLEKLAWWLAPHLESWGAQDITFDGLKLKNEIGHVNWANLAGLLRRAWFERVWCVQEIFAARDAIVQVGEWSMPWQKFADVIEFLRFFNLEKELSPFEPCQAMSAVQTVLDLRRRPKGEKAPLLMLLRQLRRLKATLPQDKIYGLLNLVCDAQKLEINVDYTIDAPTLFRKFASNQIKQYESLVILHTCSSPTSDTHLSLPSWVPDWTQECWHEPLIRETDDKPFYKTTLDSKPSFAFSDDGLTLSVRGIVLDKVTQIEQLRTIPRRHPNAGSDDDSGAFGINPRYDEEVGEKDFEHQRQWVQNAISIAFPGGECTPKQYENLWRTFVLDHEGTHRPGPEFGEYFSEWLTEIIAADTKQEQATVNFDLREEEKPDPFTTDVLKFLGEHAKCENRRFFVSEQGSYGWGPGDIREGDTVCAIYGCPVPFLMRDVEGGWRILGDAYLHGAMHGECMDARKDEVTFDLV